MQDEKQKNKITSSARIVAVDIEGVIGLDEEQQFTPESTSVATYERFEQAVAEIAEGGADKVVINIRSTGGDLGDALLIHDAAVGLGVEVVTRCYGYVASAATIIAQAASAGCREISANALYLIHCCESAVEGNSLSLSATKELLDKSDERLAEIYSEASGRPAEFFRNLMNENGGKGRWLTPAEVVEAGLADRIIAAAPITDNATSEVAMLGLPPLPRPSKGGLWASLLRRVGLAKGGRDAASQAAVPEVSVADAVARRTATPAVPPASRLHTACPTLTKECEDPPFADGPVVGQSNQQAYEADVCSIRRSMI